MKPTISNAFTNSRKSLASALSPMRADFRQTDFGWSLELSPMLASDAFNALCRDQGQHAPAANRTLLVQIEQNAWKDSSGKPSIEVIANRLSIPTLDRFGDDQLLLDESSLRQLINSCTPRRLLVVRIEGPLEEGDVKAINQAMAAGQSPLEAELRAEIALEVTGDRSVILHARRKEHALALVAENFRHYLAALRTRPVSDFAAPDLWQMERLLSLTGLLTIRPIETEVFSTSIDVGIGTSNQSGTRPADRSLIYDIPSNSWHDET